MALVKVKGKYQVTLPVSVREQAGVAVGDILEAKVERRKITLIPKRIVDRDPAEALEEVKRGEVSRPFKTAKSAIRALRRHE